MYKNLPLGLFRIEQTIQALRKMRHFRVLPYDIAKSKVNLNPSVIRYSSTVC